MVRNTNAEWGWPAKLLHWIAALVILVLLLHGWWMVHLTPRPERAVNYAWHAAVGYDLLALLVLRLLWRWMNPVPALPESLQRWEVLAALTGHIGLYVLVFGASLTGWALAGTFRTPFARDLLGIPIPQLLSGPGPDRIYHNLFEEAHTILSYLLAALIVVHIAGSLRHQLIKRNDVLRRMWFGSRSPALQNPDQPVGPTPHPTPAKTSGRRPSHPVQSPIEGFDHEKLDHCLAGRSRRGNRNQRRDQRTGPAIHPRPRRVHDRCPNPSQ